ncbi:hypothetical protein BH23CYA1_BH23CYA1_08550 [soil metagenome]
MTQLTTFTLQPFSPTAQTTDLAISGSLVRSQSVLSIVYRFEGDFDKVVIPPVGQAGDRRDQLWQQTCFEFFLGEGPNKAETDPYWEFNLSPTGDWNVFSLAGYRQGLREERALGALPFTVRTAQTQLQLALTVDVGELVDPAQPLRLGVSAVVVLASGEEAFWAIAHPGPTPDFHHPESFALELLP